MNVNFRDKNFMITSVRTIHVVAPPTILTRGIGACKFEEKRIKITLTCFEF